MFKKLSMLLAAVTLCTSVGIVLPVSAQAASGEVIVESNFQNCNLGTYTAANQMNGETDLRNGVIMVDDSDLTTGITIKNGETFESISEADIVNDGGVKVLRLNTFLKDSYVMTDGLTEEVANYPVVKSTAKVPKNSKVRIDFEMKISPRVSFYFHHSKPNHPNWRIWRFENGNGSENVIKVLDNTPTGKKTQCNMYNTHTVVMDTATGYMKIYQNNELMWEGTGNVPAWNQELFFRQISLNDASVKPTPKYIDEAKTQIESVVNPQYVYVKSVKMTTYEETALESITPEPDSSVMTPTEAVFKFNNEIKTVDTASVYVWETGETVDVKSSLIYDGKTVKVPYAFEDYKTYTVTLNGATDGLNSADAETSFTAEPWSFSNLTGNPANSSPVDNNTYFVNEDFTNSTNENLVTAANRHEAWSVVKQDNTSIVELEDGNKVLKLAAGSDFRVFYEKSLRLLDNTTTLSYDVYLGKDTKQFNVDMQQSPVAMWQYGFFKQSGDENVPGEGPMTAGEWHRVDISISDETGKSIYVDGKLAYTQPKDAVNLKDVYWIRFRAAGTEVLIDNLKLYLNKGETVLTDVTPAYDATGVKASAPLTFTYNEVIGDVSEAKLILKANDTNEPIVLTNGNGMSVNVDNYTVNVVLDNALSADLGYAVELSGLKDIYGANVTPIRTRFSTVADDNEWIMTDIDEVVSGPNNKVYSFKLKHQGDAKNAQFMVAVYNADGSLSTVNLSDTLSVDGSWTDFSVEAEYNAGKTTKLFIWENVASMTPIFGVISK